MSKTRFFTSVFAIILLVSVSISSSTVIIASSKSENHLEKAASYLISMYSPTIGLVANSEDKGPNPYGEGVSCNSTYWVYDDNLWAGWALQPFNPSIAENVTKTVQRYTSNYGRSMLFEAAIGEPVPTTVHSYKNIKVYDEIVNGNRVQVLLDRHQYSDNPGVFTDANEYVDLCCYMAINYWMMGDTNASEHWFRTGEKMWNYTTNNGFYDKAARIDGRYSNFKLGLFLLAQKVTGFQSNITGKVETAAWSCQNSLGGITTQSWLNGSFYGTANAEATSALLLSYNDNLTNRLHNRQTYEEAQLEEALKTNYTLKNWFTVLLLSTSVLATLSFFLAIKIKKISNKALKSI